MKSENDTGQQQQTKQVHAGDGANPSSGISSPIYQSATFRFETPDQIAEAMVAEAHPQFYGRYATPNTKQVEATVAALEGGEAAISTASGMAAISLVFLSLLRAGDHLIAQKTLYPTTHKLITHKLPQLGIQFTLVDQQDVAAIGAAIRPETRLVFVETPANPTLSLTDLTAVGATAKDAGLLTVADNTFATPYNQLPLAHGIDVVVHSATKYLSGHSDVVAGVVVSDAATIAKLWRNHILFGGVLHPFEAWLLERGLKTFSLRMAQHNDSALSVARYLEDQPSVRHVYYPGLTNHPQHALAKRQMPNGFGGMVCFDMVGGRGAGYSLLNRLRLISVAVSLGGPHSLITHPASTVSAVQSDEEISASGVQPGLVRLSVGLEDPEDIIGDLGQALKAL